MQQAILRKESQSEKKPKKTIDYKKNLEIAFFVNGKPISKYATIYEVFSKHLSTPLTFNVIFKKILIFFVKLLNSMRII